MSIDFQKVADAVEQASQEIKDLMFSAEIGIKIEDVAEENNLSEEKTLMLVDEIGYVILGLKSRNNFTDSLVQIGADKDVAIKINKEVTTSIFSELDKIKNTQIAQPPQPPRNNPVSQSVQSPRQERQSNVGSSFEQTILNQARAMRPAVPANLPVEPGEHRSVHDYKEGSDPYREPAE